jgi:hypothetical protein
MIKKISRWLSLPVAGSYFLIPVIEFIKGEFEGKPSIVILKETAGIWILPGIALTFIWCEFKAGAKLLTLFDIISLNPFGYSFVKSELGEGTIRFLNIIFHSVGWLILLTPLIAILIFKP